MAISPISFSRRHIVITLFSVIIVIVIFILTLEMIGYWTLGDFTVTFYRSANYLLRGENVYINSYPNLTNGREYPPFNPIWILYSVVPVSVFPPRFAEAMRFLLDVGAVFSLAYFTALWAGLTRWWMMVLLALAPWHFLMIYSGQWSAVALLGALLCYWGARRANAPEMAVGLWLALAKPNVTLLIALATLMFAWRGKVLFKTIGILVTLILLFSLAQPGWVVDLATLYLDRITHPRLADSVLLLPWYPWSQIALLIAGVIFLFVHYFKSKYPQPSEWLWAILVCASLVGALHTFTYDWFMLMLPMAWLLRDRRALIFVGLMYLYPFIWVMLRLADGMSAPSPALIPAMLMFAVLFWRILLQRKPQVAT